MNRLRFATRTLTLVTAFFTYALLLPGVSETTVQDKRKIAPLASGRVVLENIPNVTLDDVVKWNDIVQTRNGIAGNDFFGAQRLGLAPAESKCSLKGFDEWFPIEDTPNYGAKKCVCGTLLDYSQTGTDFGPEYLNDYLNYINPLNLAEGIDDYLHDQKFCDHDYDINIAPSPRFNDLLSRATNISPSWRNKIHAEIDLPFYSDLYVFSPETGLLTQKGSTWCVYGPWVVDDNRLLKDNEPTGLDFTFDRKVEIHPAEQIWWGSPQGALLISTADYSNRYNGRTDYDTDNGRKTYTVPWSQTPLQSRYALAFEIKPGAPKLWYFVADMSNDDNMTVASTDGREHELVIRGLDGDRSLVGVREFGIKDFTDIGFRDIRRRKDGTIQGYITISSAVGSNLPTVSGLTNRGALLDFSGGHIKLWIGRGDTPSEYAVQIISIKRLAKNSYSSGASANRVSFPVNPLPRGYDEAFAKFTLETSGQRQETDLSSNVGETKNFPSLIQNGFQGPFDRGASFSLKAQDRLGKNLGIASTFLLSKDYGQTRTIRIKMAYPSVHPGGFDPGKEPQVPGRPGSGAMARTVGGSPLVEEVKFEITYRISKVTRMVHK